MKWRGRETAFFSTWKRWICQRIGVRTGDLGALNFVVSPWENPSNSVWKETAGDVWPLRVDQPATSARALDAFRWRAFHQSPMLVMQLACFFNLSSSTGRLLLFFEEPENSSNSGSDQEVLSFLGLLCVQISLVRWNEPYQKLATCDSSGIIFVWIRYEGRWSIELINDRNMPVTHFSWSHDGRMAVIAYQVGFSCDAHRLYSGPRYEYGTNVPRELSRSRLPSSSSCHHPPDQRVHCSKEPLPSLWTSLYLNLNT